MRRAIPAAMLAALLVAAPAAAAPPFPDVIPLPDGFAPEGIAAGRGTTFYAGSLAGGGIYRGDLRTGDGAVLAPGDGRTFVGMSLDSRGRLWVAGGPDGAGYVIDTSSGATLAEFAFTDEPSFVNDVVVTGDAAWFTDSFRPVLYRVPIAPNGEIGMWEEVDLAGQIAFEPGQFNLNGIDATPDGGTLIAVSSFAAQLYTVDVASESATPIDLGGPLPNGDGILLHGKTLYVVQNFLNQVAVVQLAPDLMSGTVVDTLIDEDFRVPTTIARFGGSLYAVNARFDVAEPTPATPYEVVRVGP